MPRKPVSIVKPDLGGGKSLPNKGEAALPAPRATFGRNADGDIPERYSALGALLDLSIEKRMSVIDSNPVELLRVRDEWFGIAQSEGYFEEVGHWGGCWPIRKQIDYRLLTETLVTWADRHSLASAAEKINEYFLCVMAAYAHMGPWGGKRTDQEVDRIWHAAHAALERIVICCKLEMAAKKEAATITAESAAKADAPRRRSGPRPIYKARTDKIVWTLWQESGYQSYEAFILEKRDDIPVLYRSWEAMKKLSEREKKRNQSASSGE